LAESPPIQIYVLGTGIRACVQVTAETQQALACCNSAVVVHDDLAVLDFVRSYVTDVTDAATLYRAGEDRSEAYRRIADVVVTLGVKHPPTALVVHGHPLFLVSAAEYVFERAQLLGLRTVALPAVSSFDTMLCDLGFDPCYALQLFDATTMLRLGIRPNTALPLFIFQLATTLQSRVCYDRPGRSMLIPLCEHLMQVYPPAHLCRLVHSGATLLERAAISTVTLESLVEDCAIPLWLRPSLYVPPVAQLCPTGGLCELLTPSIWEALMTFKSNGWEPVPLTGVSQLQLDRLESEADAVLKAIADDSSATNVARDVSGEVLVANRLDTINDYIFDFARNSNLIGLAEWLLNTAVVPLHVECFIRPAQSSTGPAHQDHSFYEQHFTDELALSLWIPLRDVGLTSGTIEYGRPCPREILPHKRSDAADFALELCDPGSFTFRGTDVPYGACLAHHSLVVHRSGPNCSNRVRRAIAFNYRTSAYRQGLRGPRRDVSSPSSSPFTSP
jgi:Tetrapyrrole (Corrin/Porphyrin) Methylases/Phytanoyl-CoA dioxygenase (PhyH)